MKKITVFLILISCFSVRLTTAQTAPCPGVSDLSIVPVSSPVCASTTGATPLFAEASSNFATYEWFPATFLNDSSLQTTFFVQDVQTGTYTYSVVATDTGGCSETAVVSFTVEQGPTTFTVSGPDTVCTGDSTIIVATGATSYVWQGLGVDPTLDTITMDSAIVKPLVTQDYTVFGYNLAQSVCPNRDASNGRVQIAVPQPFAVLDEILEAPEVSCGGLKAKFLGSGTSLAKPFTFSYTVNLDLFTVTTVDTLDFVELDKDFGREGTFQVKLVGVSGANGCYTDVSGQNDSIEVVIKNNPIASFALDPQITSSLEPDVTVLNESQGEIARWTWDWNYGQEDFLNEKSLIEQPGGHSYAVDEEGDYLIALLVEDIYGCKDTAFEKVSIVEPYLLYVPTAFSPTGDDVNEIFSPVGLGILDYDMTIFDRWGKPIFVTNDLSVGWNGAVGNTGKVANAGTYAYVINVQPSFGQSFTTYIGRVTLVR